MTEEIKSILEGYDSLHGWKIVELNKEGQELFFVKKRLDMNRSKDVVDYLVTVYVAFEEEGTRYLGQSSTEIGPAMSQAEIRQRIEDAATGASFVKNPYYPLPKPGVEEGLKADNNLSADKLSAWMPRFAKAVYRDDHHQGGGINSAEIFLNKTAKRIITSQGIDVAFDTYKATIEVVTDWNDGQEPVELFFLQDFGGYQEEVIGDRIGGLLEESRERAHAVPTPGLKDVNVILTGESVKEFFGYYVSKASARARYEGTSPFEIGENLQGDEISGDLVNIEMLPVLEGSSKSAPYDNEGVCLKPVTLVEEGVLKAYLGDAQYASYMDIPVTGQLSNIKVAAGTISEAAMKSEPYIELVSFSDFQVNPLTGDFGGEIRLARYFDGTELKAVTGGAVSANLKDVQGDLTFTSERAQHDNYLGPKSILFKGVEIAG